MEDVWIVSLQFGLGLLTALYVLWPLWAPDGEPGDSGGDSGRESGARRTVLEALGDLEYEHATGKINDRDFRRLRSHYLRRAAALFDEEELKDVGDSMNVPDDRLERAIERARSRLS